MSLKQDVVDQLICTDNGVETVQPKQELKWLFRCDLCHEAIIGDVMYACRECPNYDVCLNCFPVLYTQHNQHHQFFKTVKNEIIKCDHMTGTIMRSTLNADRTEVVIDVIGQVEPQKMNLPVYCKDSNTLSAMIRMLNSYEGLQKQEDEDLAKALEMSKIEEVRGNEAGSCVGEASDTARIANDKSYQKLAEDEIVE